MALENDLSRKLEDEEAEFEQLFKLHYRKLTFFANRFTNDLPVSEEIVAEVFTLIWERRDELSYNSSSSGYLFKMVQNKCLNHLKHQNIENLYVKYLERNNLLNEMATAVQNGFEEKELAAQIKCAIESLTPKSKEVFMLSRVNNLKYSEIAKVLNISPKTVERHMSIALEKLRQSLKRVSCFLLF